MVVSYYDRCGNFFFLVNRDEYNQTLKNILLLIQEQNDFDSMVHIDKFWQKERKK